MTKKQPHPLLVCCGQDRLGFGPTVPLYFHVFEYGVREGESVGVHIYSSNITVWIFKESKWGDIVLCTYVISVFLNGFMHFSGGTTQKSSCHPYPGHPYVPLFMESLAEQ
jgi:hypothetical protein